MMLLSLRPYLIMSNVHMRGVGGLRVPRPCFAVGSVGTGAEFEGARFSRRPARNRADQIATPSTRATNTPLARLSGFLIRSNEAEGPRNNALLSAIAPEGCP